MTTALWIAVALAVAGGIAMFATSWYRRDHESADLGAVSHQWIAEHRFGQGRGDIQR